MSNMTDQFNEVNKDVNLGRLIIYQSTDEYLISASERIKLLDDGEPEIDKDSYFFTGSMLSGVISSLDQQPKGRILTNMPSLAIGLSAYYDNEVWSFSDNVFPRVYELDTPFRQFTTTVLPSLDNINQLQRLFTYANNGDNIVFIDDLV